MKYLHFSCCIPYLYLLNLTSTNMRNITIFALLLFSHYVYANSGWIVTTRYYNSLENPANARLEQVYMLNGFMKTVNGDLSTVFDMKNGEIVYINNSNQTYWKGKPDKFNAEVKADLEQMIEQKLNGIEEEQKEAMRQVYNEVLKASFPDVEVEQTPRNFSVQKEETNDMVSGYNTLKFQVYEDGILLETLWIASDLMISKDFSFVDLSHFLNNLSRGAYSTSFESSKEYFDLLEQGYPVKIEMTKSDGYNYVSEVVEAKNVELSSKDFSVPKGYTQGTLSDVGVWDAYR